MSRSEESLVLLLLCSSVGLGNDSPKPLTVREWNALARALQEASLTPTDLLSREPADWQGKLNLDVTTGERLAHLLSRRSELLCELERLSQHGIFPITRADIDYPERYRQRLKDSAPTVLFYAGEKTLPGKPGVAVVGSRHPNQVVQECAAWLGNTCGVSGMVLYSGGARGVDSIGMTAALETNGTVVGILADSLTRAVKTWKSALIQGTLCLITPYHPAAGFSVGAAMGRNRLIYSLADYAIVVAAEAESGGTWAGATEALRHEWVPVFVLEHSAAPEGNQRLIQKGALPFPYPFPESPDRLSEWLKYRVTANTLRATQERLF